MELERIFYNEDNPAYLGSIDKLSNALKDLSITSHNIKKSKKKRRKPTKKNVQNWLNKQDAYTLHRPARLNFPRNHYFTFNIDDLWEADLISLPKLKDENDGYRYVLTVVDVFSKFGFTRPLKTKGGAEVTNAFKNVIDESEEMEEGAGFKRTPRTLQTDRGKEFINVTFKRFLNSRNIKLQFPLTQSKHKAAIAERFNRTIQSHIHKHFTASKTKRYIDVLPKITKAYNNSVHKTIKMRPRDVNEKNVLKVYNNTRAAHHQKNEINTNIYTQPFAVGDSVRVVRRKPIFEPGYTNKWSKEVFSITKIIEKKPYFFYKIEDSTHRPVREKFYNYELQLINKKK